MWYLHIPNDFYNYIFGRTFWDIKLKPKFQDANEIVKSFTDNDAQFQLLFW